MRGLIALCLLSLAAGGCGTGTAVTDCYSVGRYKRLTQPSLDLYVMNVKTENGSRVDLYGQMPYTRLHFVKADNVFAAAYSVLFLIRDKDGEPVQSREVTRTVSAGSYAETVSLTVDAFLQSMTLPPGTYTLECATIDQNSLVRHMQRSEVATPVYWPDSVTTSDMLLLLQSRSDDKGIVLHPLFPQMLEYARDSIGVFQEIYGAHQGDSISVGMTYRTLPAERRALPRSTATMVPPYPRFVGSCSRGLDSVALDTHAVVAGRNGTIQSIQFYPLPPEGIAEIERTVSVTRGGMRTIRSARMFLYRNDAGHPIGNDIVDALRYIAHYDEYEAVRGTADSLRAGAVDRFWDDHGGSARRTEFEVRVDEANKLFSACTDGSRTPMGITYIVCGPPDYVECRIPYIETWYYTVGSLAMPVEFRRERRNDAVPYFELTLNSVDEQLWGTFIDKWRRH